MNQDELEIWILDLIAKNRLHDFYTCSQWLNLRQEVLDEYKKDGCLHCKSKGFYKEANTVHHEQYVRKYPRLALSKTYEYKGKIYRQLTPLCDECHKAEHNKHRKKEKPLTVERW